MSTTEQAAAGTTPEPIDDLRARRIAALKGGGQERIDRLHASGRLTARERIELLIDEGSWTELGMLAEPEIRRADLPTTGDAIVTGLATVDGRKVAILAIDATVMAGTTAPVNMRKQNRVAEWAGRKGFPLICLSDNDGGRVPDLLGWRFSGVPFDFTSFLQSPDGCAEIPRVTAALGPSYGDAALHAAMGDFVVMHENAAIALSGPPVIKAAIGEDVDGTELGGPKVAAGINGAAHSVVAAEADAFAQIRRFLSYLPSSADQPAPVVDPVPPARSLDELAKVIPKSRRRGYDMHKLIEIVVDGDSYFPWGEQYGKSLLCGLARIDGHAVGVIASQPMHLAGALDVPALRKEARFIDLCDRFNLPLVFLQDVPGLMIGTHAEQAGILGAYDGVVARLARAKVPKVAVIIRKAFGGGHIAMGGRPVKPDLLVAWPSAEMGFMEPTTGVRTVHRRRLDALLAERGQDAYEARVAELEAEWGAESQPWEAAANIILDDIIEPAETRAIITTAIDFAWGTKPRVSPAGA